jgi:hypothetical protein
MVYCCTWIWKFLKESSTGFLEAFCSQYLLIMLYWLLCKVLVSCCNVVSIQYTSSIKLCTSCLLFSNSDDWWLALLMQSLVKNPVINPLGFGL